MVRTGKHIWHDHPAVNNHLTTGERAADSLKKWFGTWTALFCTFGFIAAWMLVQGLDPKIAWDRFPYILLNLCLSCLAAVQGIILQISANRQDRINAQAELHAQQTADTTSSNTSVLLDLQRQQMTMLDQLKQIRHAVEADSARDIRSGP